MFQVNMDEIYAQLPQMEPDIPSPLHIAASNQDHTELARLLSILIPADKVNQRDSLEYTPLHAAIQNNNIESVRLLLQHGADPRLWFPRHDVIFSAESTSVTEAADLGFLEILELLIENGGPVSSIALYNATISGQFECVKTILAWLDNKNRTTFDDRVSRSEAVTWGLRLAAGGWRDELVEFILKTCEPDSAAIDGAFLEAMVPDFEHDDWPIRNCVRHGLYEEARKKRIDVVRLLLEAGADVDANPSSYAMKPLHQIALQGNGAREIFDLLLDRNVEVDSLNTALFQAVLADDVYFAQRLIEKGASVTHVDKLGNTLLYASTFNFTPACSTIMSFLLANGVSSDAINVGGRTALHKASSGGNLEAIKLLLFTNPDLIKCKSNEDFTALHFISGGMEDQQKVDIATILLKHGADINAVTAEGWSVLQRAVAHNSNDSIQFIAFLLDNDADMTLTNKMELAGNSLPNHISGDATSANLRATGVVRQGIDSLLHIALNKYYAGSKTTRIISLLLDRGADIESRDAQGRTPLLRAVGKWNATTEIEKIFHSERVMELINRGADINARDNEGLGLEDWVKNKGYTINMEDGKVVGFNRIPGPTTDNQLAGLDSMGRGRGRGRVREIATLVRARLADAGIGRGHGVELVTAGSPSTSFTLT